MPDFFDAPIWKLEIEYERYARYTYTYKAYIRATNATYDLLMYFPKKTMPADFLTPDIEDWAKDRLSHYSESSVRRDVAHIHAFWRWMYVARGIEIQNPAVVVRLNNRRVQGRIEF